jgi:hypothetical protein
MKKHLITLLLVCTLTTISKAQHLNVFADSIPTYLKELQEATNRHFSLWNKDLYSSLLLVNPETREIYANEPDNNGELVKSADIYKGVLPYEINFANTAMEWNGKMWAMIILPLPNEKEERINLLSHELFHKSQPSLNFTPTNPNNPHLDTKDGRVYFRLEMEALKSGILAQSEKEKRQHLTNAMLFRKYRNQLFLNSDSTENLLELNEGLAEYTGQTVSGFNSKENAEKNFKPYIDNFMSMPTFVRSFAYRTIAAYGYLATQVKNDWNKDITDNTNLADYFIKLFNIKIPNNLKQTVEKNMSLYQGQKIVEEEVVREEKNKKLLTEYRTKFIEQSHLDIFLEKMQFSFDPRNIVSLDDIGTVYPRIRISDVWGVLTATNGALVTSGWKKVTVTKPMTTDNLKLNGDGWTLDIAADYSVVEKNGNFIIEKNK